MSLNALPFGLKVVAMILVLSLAVYVRWDRFPQETQDMALRALRILRRLIMLPVQVVAISGLFVIYWLISIPWIVLQNTILGKPCKVTIKLA